MSAVKVVDFRHIRLDPADNGFILNYTEVTEKENSFESRDHKDRNKVFGEDDIDEALSEMKKLLLFKKNKGNETKVSLPISMD